MQMKMLVVLVKRHAEEDPGWRFCFGRCDGTETARSAALPSGITEQMRPSASISLILLTHAVPKIKIGVPTTNWELTQQI